MKTGKIKEKICPVCGQKYNAPAAVSRIDNRTLICPNCGTRQALSSIGVPPEEQEKILEIIRRNAR